ncbi:MAG TPA: DNA repair protein RadA [Actinomycetota bacterium]|jgi:DNA repair protein RadA/Sms
MSNFTCNACGHSSPRWFGRCPECGAWSSATEPPQHDKGGRRLDLSVLAATTPAPARVPTNVGELDRVLGGGIVPGTVALLFGDPGAGKSTLATQLMAGIARDGRKALLISGEESPDQVALRAQRLDADMGDIGIAASRSLPDVLATVAAERPDLVVVDSIQTLEDPRFDQAAGSVVQVRECAASLVAYAKSTGTSTVLIGHVTKDGTVAGPRTLEHVVDVVLSLEGDRDHALRLLRATKNRFGACDETGVFAMRKNGLHDVADPSSMLLEDRYDGVSGSCVFPGTQGSRPMLLELQALVSESEGGQPRRVAMGIEQKRLALLLGILSKSMDLKFGRDDVFVSVAGGIAVREPGADLALCLAIHSAKFDVPLPLRTVAIGEVGLGGEVRRVPNVDRRLSEAHRLGFDKAFVPRGTERGPRGMRLQCVDHVGVALARITGSHERERVQSPV